MVTTLEVQGYSAAAFSYALCGHKAWTGRKARRAHRVANLCEAWSRTRPASLVSASMLAAAGVHLAKRRQGDAQAECERYVRGAVGAFTWFIFGAIIRAVITHYIQWYINNYFSITCYHSAR